MKSLHRKIMSRQSSTGHSSSSRNRSLAPYFQWCAGQLAIAGLLAMAIPGGQATAASNKFAVCSAELLRANISPNLASTACAEALEPMDLSECVLRMASVTPAIADRALGSCTRVRRPVELAKCVVEINRRTESSDISSVLDHCRRSLLPLRFSSCVIGLSNQTDFSTARTMSTCIAAEGFTRQLSPTPVRSTPPNSLPDFVPDFTPGPEVQINGPL